MVHALERIHGWLAPGGLLIDLHPSGDPPPLHVRIGDAHHCAGWLRETDDYIEYEQATAALDAVVRRGLYRRQARRTFAFTTYADTLADLRDYLARNWADAVLEEPVARHITDWLQSPTDDKEIRLREIVTITALAPR